MRSYSLVLILLAAIATPANLVAQESESPPTLRLSFFMCDFNQLDAAMEEVESQVIPVWDELVKEGMVMSHGFFVHSWASEWNVGIYTVAESIDAVIKASDEAGRRLAARYGEDPGAFGTACPHHRDGFYVMGPSTGNEEEEGEGN
ncbi:MAG: hypothetical protein JSU87_12890 [Gemmatimonadota bacterium]|nr:MAG: hypothetical protein JSU87_12890 [Gemmatimonadota bacterium]